MCAHLHQVGCAHPSCQALLDASAAPWDIQELAGVRMLCSNRSSLARALVDDALTSQPCSPHPLCPRAPRRCAPERLQRRQQRVHPQPAHRVSAWGGVLLLSHARREVVVGVRSSCSAAQGSTQGSALPMGCAAQPCKRLSSPAPPTCKGRSTSGFAPWLQAAELRGLCAAHPWGRVGGPALQARSLRLGGCVAGCAGLDRKAKQGLGAEVGGRPPSSASWAWALA